MTTCFGGHPSDPNNIFSGSTIGGPFQGLTEGLVDETISESLSEYGARLKANSGLGNTGIVSASKSIGFGSGFITSNFSVSTDLFFDSSFNSTPDNLAGDSKRSGIEFSADWAVSEGLNISASLSDIQTEDGSGTDEIRHIGDGGATIDLRTATLQIEDGGGGFISAANQTAGGFTIAHGAVIENATGGSGADRLNGNDAANLLQGGEGFDTMYAGQGNDTLLGQNKADLLYAGGGNDIIFAGFGNDTINAGDGDDFARGDEGDDSIAGGAGDDFLVGSEGNDQLFGSEGFDFLFGGLGDDGIFGGDDDDELRGGEGDDLIIGGLGIDLIVGGFGDDQEIQ